MIESDEKVPGSGYLGGRAQEVVWIAIIGFSCLTTSVLQLLVELRLGQDYTPHLTPAPCNHPTISSRLSRPSHHLTHFPDRETERRLRDLLGAV